MAGLNDAQKAEVAQMIQAALVAASDEVRQSITQATTGEAVALRAAGREFEVKMEAQRLQQEKIARQLAAHQVEMQSVLAQVRESTDTTRAQTVQQQPTAILQHHSLQHGFQ